MLKQCYRETNSEAASHSAEPITNLPVAGLGGVTATLSELSGGDNTRTQRYLSIKVALGNSGNALA